MKGEKGFALVITLIVTTLLIALMVEFVNQTYVGTSQSHNFVASQQASLLAESGADAGRKLLEYELGLMHSDYSSLLDTWAKPDQGFEDEVGSLKIRIEEESGKLNLNTIALPVKTHDFYYPMAQRLLRKLELPQELADAVADWIENADAPPQRSGAKSPYYNALKVPYDAKGAKLDSVEELGLVKGFTPAIVAKLKPYVTVYGSNSAETETRINVNTAPKELLLSLDEQMTDDLANRILERRKTSPIKNLSADVPGMEKLAAPLSNRISYRGFVYRIHSEAKVGESVSITEAVVRLNGTQSEILYWREY